MKYQMELEIADDKISLMEEFFKSISFVRKVTAIAPETKKRYYRLNTPRAGCMKGTFTWMSDDFNAPVDDFNEYR
jgi:hypothetical protein